MEHERSLTVKTEYLLREYRRIIQELIPNCTTIDQFAEAFSDIFDTYQNSNSRKMDPDSVREGKVSCSSAAALAGIWWLEQFPQLTPIFLIEETQRTGQSHSSAHVNVALPTISPISEREALQAFYDPNRSRSDLHLIDWTTYSKMKRSNPQQLYEVYPISDIKQYLKNRLSVLGLPKKYSTRNILLGQIGATT